MSLVPDVTACISDFANDAAVPRPPEGSKKVDPLIWNPIRLRGTLKEPC